jgi:hypothetical protein
VKDVLAKLSGGDWRSLGRSKEVIQDVLKKPALFADVFSGLLHEDRVVRMRASDVVEKVTRERPELLQPFKLHVLGTISTLPDQVVRWHVAQMLPRLRLTAAERDAAVRILMNNLDDKSSILRTLSMQALVDMGRGDERLLAQVTPVVERLTRTGTPAMKSRGRKLLKQIRGDLAARTR